MTVGSWPDSSIEIDADLTVVPMEGYTRDMIFQDTSGVIRHPNIPDIDSVFGYMATGFSTGIFQADS